MKILLSLLSFFVVVMTGTCQAEDAKPKSITSFEQIYDYVAFQIKGCGGNFYSLDWQLYCQNIASQWQPSLAMVLRNENILNIYNALLHNNNEGKHEQLNLQIHQFSKPTLYNFGLTLAHNLDIERAIAMFQVLVDTYPDFAAAQHNLLVLTAKTPPDAPQSLQLKKQSARNQMNYWQKLIIVLDEERKNTTLRTNTLHYATPDIDK